LILSRIQEYPLRAVGSDRFEFAGLAPSEHIWDWKYKSERKEKGKCFISLYFPVQIWRRNFRAGKQIGALGVKVGIRRSREEPPAIEDSVEAP
jgi:hypothetical protein